MISNSKVEKRPRNFCGANVDTLGLFQMESVSDANEIKGNVLAMIFSQILRFHITGYN